MRSSFTPPNALLIVSAMNLFLKTLSRCSIVWCGILFCIALCSCSKKGMLPNEKQGKADIATFLFRQIAKYGGSNAPTSGVATGITKYVYSEDKDGFQVVCEGNRVAVLQSLFQPHFGNPAITKTNATGLSSFVYALHQTGLAITCGLDEGMIDGRNQELTHFVAVRSGALK